MKTIEYKNRLENLDSILKDSVFLLGNDEFPIYNFSNETYPDEIPLIFKPANLTTTGTENAILNSGGDVVAVDNYLNRNFACQLCPDRDRGIRGFLIRGRKKLLILHYSGFTGNSGSFLKKSNKTIFRTKEIEECFQDLIESHLDTSYHEFYFQEYPACHFSKNMDSANWERRSTECDGHILETVKREGIKAILVLGSSAVLRWTPQFSKENQGKLMNWKFGDGTIIPFAITRSPDALHHSKIHSPDKYQNIRSEMGNVFLKLQKSVGGWE